jgi:hypothetical protein
MNTNNIKSFAKQARLILMEGVKQRLLYWGFDENGKTSYEITSTIGGYDFRGKLYTDESVPPKWNKLKAKLINKQAVQDTVEEAAYTWFNRIMAIKILEKRGYLPPTLQYVTDLKTPHLVQEAKRGQHQLKQKKYVELLQEYLLEDKEEQALGLLLIRFCNNNVVLHDVFGRIDDYTEILLPSNLLARNGIIDLINSNALEDEQYQEVELIGWLYQFYISDKKDEVFKGFKANKKARPEDIPAATQIFTPKWIVKYMVENTVGKIYLDYDNTSSLKSEMKYLVENETVIPNEVEGQTIHNSKLIIHNLSELTLIDPAAGSGHILVTGFDLLFKMYREQGYTAKNAVLSILQNNLYGLDIDDRAMQLARFAVLIKAAEFYPEVLTASDSNPIVLPHIYSFPENTIEDLFAPEAISVSKLDNYTGYYVAEDVITKSKEDIEDEDTGEIISIDRTTTFLKVGDRINEEVIVMLTKENITSVVVSTYKFIAQFLNTTDVKIIRQTAYALLDLKEGKNIGAALKLYLDTSTREQIEKQFNVWNKQHDAGTLDILQVALWQNLKPFIEVLLVMTKKYTAVVANPPYMGQKSMNVALKDYINVNYPETKSDLMTVFMEVIPNMTLDNSRFALINLPSWLFLSSFEKLRENYIKNYHFESLLHMGRGIFGIDFGSVAFTMKKEQKENATGNYFRLHERNFQHILFTDIEKLFLYANGNTTYKYDFSQYRGEEGITEIPEKGTETGQRIYYQIIPQENFEKIPGNAIGYWVSKKIISNYKNEKISDKANIKTGMHTGNNVLFARFWHECELNKINFKAVQGEKNLGKWFPYNKGGAFRKWSGNRDYVVNWENEGTAIHKYHNLPLTHNGAPVRAKKNQFLPSISWSFVSSGTFGVRFYEQGFMFDVGGSSLFTKNDFYIGAFLNTNVAHFCLGVVNPTLNFQVGNISNLPFILKEDISIKTVTTNCIDISKKDWDSRETSWDFEKVPLLNESTSLKNAYKKWQDNVTQDYLQLHANEEELNRIFIGIYGLQEELTPEVALKDITILQEELDRNQLEKLELVFREQGSNAIVLPIKKDEVISQFLSYCIGLFMGRYRLDKPGLHIAHPNPSEEELDSYVIPSVVKGLITQDVVFAIDTDAILPLMSTECAFPDDAWSQIKNLINNLWREETLTENLNFVNECLGTDLDKWLTDKFWGYHTSMYKKKPIYWMFSSNPKKPQQAAFRVLVYMHRMDKYTVSKIQRNYLHPHQEWIKQEIDKLVTNEANLSKTEIKRLEKLRNWQIECRDYNEVLKAIALNEITFDLDDGVSVNYEKFEGAVAKI